MGHLPRQHPPQAVSSSSIHEKLVETSIEERKTGTAPVEVDAEQRGVRGGEASEAPEAREGSMEFQGWTALSSVQFADAGAWNRLGDDGGGTVHGTNMTGVQCYIKAVEADPTFAKAWCNLGCVFANHGKGGLVGGTWLTEVQCYYKAIVADPAFAEAWLCLGRYGGGIVDGKFVISDQCFIRAIETDPNLASAWHCLGRAGGGTVNGKRMAATQCYAMAVERDPVSTRMPDSWSI